MAGFHFTLPDAQKGLFADAAVELKDRIARGLQLAVGELQHILKAKGDADIQSAGNFSARWTKAFQVDCEPTAKTTSDQYELTVFFDDSIPYAHIHEFGGTITAKGTLFGPPLLWIPLSFGDVPKSGGGPNAGKMTAQEYGASVSPLFRVTSKKGTPLLLDIKDKRPRYFGIASVTLPQRFHIRDICNREMNGFEALFQSAIATTTR